MAVKLLIRDFLEKHNITIVTLILLSASVFYLIGAQRKMSLIHSSNPEAFSDGEIVVISGVVDGDEVLIENDKGITTRFRVLGIKSFSSTVSDPALSEYGKICFQYLKTKATEQKARLSLADNAVDGEGRLLGTLFLLDSKGQYSVDVGLDLISKGYSLVYTRYDFDRIQQYLDVQKKAQQDGAGFWSNAMIAARSISLLKMWEEERLSD